MADTVRFWGFGCSHITKDIQYGHKPIERACRHAEDFGYDYAIDFGDIDGSQGLPKDQNGPMYRQQFQAGSKNHRIEDIIGKICANHDRTNQPGVAAMDWHRKWIDPFYENPQTSGVNKLFEPFPVHSGTVDAYERKIGSLSFLFMSDVNRPLTPKRGILGGDPGGVVTPEAYQWWKDTCAAYRGTGQTVITCAHYLPKGTTTATVEYGGGTYQNGTYSGLYHGAGYTNGLASSYLAFVGETMGRPFIEHLVQHPGDCHIWVGAHNHVKSGKKVGGLGHIEMHHGCNFIQNGALTKHHHGSANEVNPKSRFYEFTNGSNVYKVHAYMHQNAYNFSKGLYSTREYTLPHPVQF